MAVCALQPRGKRLSDVTGSDLSLTFVSLPPTGRTPLLRLPVALTHALYAHGCRRARRQRSRREGRSSLWLASR